MTARAKMPVSHPLLLPAVGNVCQDPRSNAPSHESALPPLVCLCGTSVHVFPKSAVVRATPALKEYPVRRCVHRVGADREGWVGGSKKIAGIGEWPSRYLPK